MHDYLEMANRLEAQETLILFNASMYPVIKKEARSKMHKSIHKIAFPPAEQNKFKGPITTEEFAKAIGGRING